MNGALAAFAAEVGPADAGPVTCVGGRTQWDVGGAPDPSAREVKPPSGVVHFEPAEMIVEGVMALAGQVETRLERACCGMAEPGVPRFSRQGAEGVVTLTERLGAEMRQGFDIVDRRLLRLEARLLSTPERS